MGKIHLNNTKREFKEIDKNLEKDPVIIDKDDEMKKKLKKEIEELQAIYEFKDNDFKFSTKK